MSPFSEKQVERADARPSDARPYKRLKKGTRRSASPSEPADHAVSLSPVVDGKEMQGPPPPRATTQLQNSLDIDLVRAALEQDYQVLEELGRGGMAVVYRAREKALDREVAIKVLPSYMTIDEAFVERFQHEARTAGKLEHPNIVPIYRVGMAGRVIFFVMKYLKGQSLSTVLRTRPKLGVAEIRRILMETTSALGYAAKHGVVHRDIKPDNILLDDEGRCVVTDFGIAKSTGGPNTAAGTSMGTPRYMSPEHARGHKLDGRSDLYSLGIVAYQCLVGYTPYEAEDPFAVLYKHINEPLPKPDLTSHEENVLYAIVEKMLAKAPEDRFQTADDLIVALGGQATSTTRTLITGGRISHTAHQRRSGLSATEIIVTPTFGERVRDFSSTIRRFSRERPASTVALGIGAVIAASLLVNAVRNGDTAPVPVLLNPPAAGASAKVPGPGDSARPAAVGATTAALAGTTTAVVAVAGSTTGAIAPVRPESVAPPGAKAPAPVTPVLSPSARAAARRDAMSRCPRRPDSTSISLDSVPAQRRGAKTTVNYDVCGLAAGAPFSTRFTLSSQRTLSRDQSKTFGDFLEVASSARSRRSRVLDLAELEPGRYKMLLLVKDAKGNEYGFTRDFRINER